MSRQPGNLIPSLSSELLFCHLHLSSPRGFAPTYFLTRTGHVLFFQSNLARTILIVVFVILLFHSLRHDHISNPYLLAIHCYLTTAFFRGSMPLMFRGRRLACPALIQPYYISYVYCSLILVTEKLYTALVSVTHYSMMHCFFPRYIRALGSNASHSKVAIYTKEFNVIKFGVETIFKILSLSFFMPDWP